MTDWKIKVKKEKSQLFKKIEKLQKFLKSNPQISDKQYRLLDTQFHIMISYHNILIARLEEK